MGDRLRWPVTIPENERAFEVDSAFYPAWDGKVNISYAFRLSINMWRWGADTSSLLADSPSETECAMMSELRTINIVFIIIMLLLLLLCYYIIVTRWWLGVVVNALVAVNEVAVLRTRLLLGWVTVCGQINYVGIYVTNHVGQLSLPSLWGR